MSDSRPIVIWKIGDGRPGHENQVAGLVDALARRISCVDYRIDVDNGLRGLRSLLPGSLTKLADLPAPDVLIGAGHATHLTILACQRRFGGRSVVVMKPSLPVGIFDCCLIPAHDHVRVTSRRVIRFEGALNRIQPEKLQDDGRGLILIGGHSRHFRWAQNHLFGQLDRILAGDSQICWTIATSQRTPPDFVRNCRLRYPSHAVVAPDERVGTWLSVQLQTAGTVWVTCDSVSMLYEAATAGARVGMLELPANGRNRVAAEMRRVCQRGRATAWSEWIRGVELKKPEQSFCEADRCAEELIGRLLPHAQRSCRFERSPVLLQKDVPVDTLTEEIAEWQLHPLDVR
ncbi:MAG: ELM1/GtrOC1 family putative glycosyltransferase [Planctomycetaceae bacterium]